MNTQVILQHIRNEPGFVDRIRKVVEPYLNAPTIEMDEESFGELLDDARGHMLGEHDATLDALDEAYMAILREEWERVKQ